MEIESRKLKILGAIIECFIKNGEPVGSKAVAQMLDFPISSATIRNEMSALEKLGFLEQPHTSAGRVPTYLGYRLYINQLMEPKPLSTAEKQMIDDLIYQKNQTSEIIVDNAVNMLAQLTGCTALTSTTVPRFSVITKVEVIPAGHRLYALLIITSTGSVKNKVCRLEFDLTNDQLEFFANFINKNLTGLNIDSIDEILQKNLALALGSYLMSLSPLLYTVYELSQEFSRDTVNIAGQDKLLCNSEINSGEILRFVSNKPQLNGLLNSAFDGINVVFGKENNTLAVSNSSLITSSYSIGNQKAGTLGILGPIRLDYAKIIPYVEYFSDSITKILSEVIDTDDT